MIKKLRRRIILVNMLLVGIVILMIFAVVCVNSYSNSVRELERGLSHVADNQGFGGDMQFDKKDEFKIENPEQKNDMPDDRNMERPVQISSYIVVQVDKDGNITSTKESDLSMDEDDLKACVETVMKEQNMSGQIDGYSLMYVKHDTPDGYSISFADNSGIYSSLWNTLLLTFALFIGSMAVIFFISLVLSGFAVKPVKTAWEQQKQFVADASHELKTPLTVILANNNIMMSHTENCVKDEMQWLESTEEEAQHMKKLIDQMLFLAKSDAGETNVEMSDVDFSEIVEGASLNFEPVAFEKNVMIDSQIESEITLRGNATQLNQLTHILIDNAVKYSAENSTVTITLSKSGDSTEFSVNNHGTVIAQDDLEHIFDRFYRAEKSRTTKGYGLGLSIAQKIVQGMNGKLTAESNEQDGTTFSAVFR